MAVATYTKGKWKTEVGAEELASGKFRGVVLLFHEGGSSPEQIQHRTTDEFDTTDGAVAEATVLAQHILDEL
jgi:hypothetical protein